MLTVPPQTFFPWTGNRNSSKGAAMIPLPSFSVNLKDFYPVGAPRASTVTRRLGVDISQAFLFSFFFNSAQLLKTFGGIAFPLTHGKEQKGAAAFHVSKASIPQPVLMEIAVELYLRGSEAGVLSLCSGLEEEEGCQNNSCVPSVRRRNGQAKFPIAGRKFTGVLSEILRRASYLFRTWCSR